MINKFNFFSKKNKFYTSSNTKIIYHFEKKDKNIEKENNNFFDTSQINKILNIITDSEVQNCKILGSYGWSYYFIDDINDENITDMSFPKDIKELQWDNKTIDEYIGNKISKQVLCNVISKTKLLLDNDDIFKLKYAFKFYKSKKYYNCCSLLLGMIDAQNIKQELYDIKNAHYDSSNININNGQENIDQGWNAFVIVFRNHLSNYFNNIYLTGKNSHNKSKNERFETFVNNAKYYMDNDIGYYILCIAYPLITIFSDCSWRKCINGEKPNVINRNWLMHGMYSINDINKYDCMKLFLILYQIANLFNKIKNNKLYLD